MMDIRSMSLKRNLSLSGDVLLKQLYGVSTFESEQASFEFKGRYGGIS